MEVGVQQNSEASGHGGQGVGLLGPPGMIWLRLWVMGVELFEAWGHSITCWVVSKGQPKGIHGCFLRFLCYETTLFQMKGPVPIMFQTAWEG